MTTNSFAGECSHCKKIVQPGDGFVVGKRGAWKVTHNACVPVADTIKYSTERKTP